MFVVIVTAQGMVKRTSLEEYRQQSRGGSGVGAINLGDGDKVVSAVITDGKKDLMVVTAKGMSIRFAGEDARAMGRTASGVRGISLKDGDCVAALVVCG